MPNVKSTAIEKYLKLASIYRRRVEFAETVLASSAPNALKAETACMQGRKIIETIAFMCLVAMQNSFGEIGVPSDVKTHWNASVIFMKLKKKNLNVLPSPSKMKPSDNLDYKSIFEGIPEYRLTYDELKGLYEDFHKGLHEPNPFSNFDDDKMYENLVQIASNAVEKLRKFAWVHFISIKGDGFMVDLKNTHDLTVVVPVSKLGELPENFQS